MFLNLFSSCFGSQAVRAVSLTFRTISADGCPVAGAVYQLKCSCGKYLNAISNRCGCVTFDNVAPGSYALTQLAAPSGYEADAASHEVEIAKNAAAKIDGLPLSCFRSINEKAIDPANASPVPTNIAHLTEASYTVKGEGEAGCKIEVEFPNHAICCGIVKRDGTWSIDVPGADTLEAGDVLKLRQTCKCMDPSETIEVIVA